MMVLFDGLIMEREWRMTRLIRGSKQGSVLVVAQWVGRGRDRFIPGRTA